MTIGVGTREPRADAAGADLYAAYARRLLGIVAGKVQTTPENIEDACHFAWAHYLARVEEVDSDSARGWLATTAVRQAYKLHARQARVGSLDQALERGAEPVAREDPARIAEQHEQLSLVDQLSVRQQRIVYRRAAGLSYAEISQLTGDSRRTVERQVLRARRRLAELQRASAGTMRPLRSAARNTESMRLQR